MQSRRVVPTAMACVFVLVSSAPAAAQGAVRSIEWFGGYSYLRDPGSSILSATAADDGFPIGWAAGVARQVSRRFSLVGEAAGHYKTRTTLVEDVSLSFHAFLAGPRASGRIGRTTEFGQLLAGIAHGRGEAFGTKVSVTDVSVQPGGGVDYPLARRFAARFQLDYRWIRASGGRNHASQFRAVAALVFH